MSKLFQKAKLAVKFRRAGEGHALNESSTPSTSNQSQAPQKPRKAPSSDTEKAGQAALERLNRLQETRQSRPPKSTTATWKTPNNEPSNDSETVQNIAKLKLEVKTEMERERKLNKPQQTMNAEKEVITGSQKAATVLAVSGVYLKCPFCSGSFLRRDVRTHMEECLIKSLVNDPTLTPANMVKSLNKDQAKTQCCVDVLVRYLDNILQNPEDEKYRKIKQGNKVFQEKVRPIKGAMEFLLSCGFVEKPLPDIPDVFCFVLEEVNADVLEKLLVMKEVLLGAEPCKPTLDRSLKVLQPSLNSETLELPDDFFELSSDEVKRMQIERSDEIERNTQLRTREMREKEKNPARIYRFTLLRVRFPDGIILQGTFHAREKASALISFVREQLQSDWLPFALSEPGGGQLIQEESSFSELGLVPAAILNFAWDATIMADINATSGTTSTNCNVYLKQELLNNLEHTGQL